MFSNRESLFLVISICMVTFFSTYDYVKSEEIRVISGIAKVTDGDTIQIDEKKYVFLELMLLKKNNNVENLGYLYLLYL